MVLYLVLTLLLGLWLARRNRGEDDFFVAGRSLSGWLAGWRLDGGHDLLDRYASLCRWPCWDQGARRGLGMVEFRPGSCGDGGCFCNLWRRSGVLTDAAFTELRYGGPVAAWLRGVKAFLLALPVNCIGIGYAFLALRKVVEALGIVMARQEI